MSAIPRGAPLVHICSCVLKRSRAILCSSVIGIAPFPRVPSPNAFPTLGAAGQDQDRAPARDSSPVEALSTLPDYVLYWYAGPVFTAKFAKRQRHSFNSLLSAPCWGKGIHREVYHRQPSSSVVSARRSSCSIYWPFARSLSEGRHTLGPISGRILAFLNGL